MENSNVTKYIENRLSIERHKINLLSIYNREYNLNSKSHVFNQRVLNNKKFSKVKVQEEIDYYINKQNIFLSKKIHEINSRPNVSKKVFFINYSSIFK